MISYRYLTAMATLAPSDSVEEAQAGLEKLLRDVGSVGPFTFISITDDDGTVRIRAQGDVA